MRGVRIALMALILGMATAAFALPGGGGMGGGGWSGGGGGGAGGAPTTDASGSPSLDAQPLAPMTLVLFVVGGVAALGLLAMIATGTRPRSRSIAESRDVRVGVLHVAFDRSAREKIQRELRAIASAAVTDRAEGRVAMLHETATVLRRLVASSAYAGGVTEAMTTRHDARRRFRAHVTASRALLDSELVQNRDGTTSDIVDADERPGDRARHRDDDRGLVLVTLVVALRESDALSTVPTDRTELARAFADACNVLPHELVAVEIIWTPASGTDVMTAFALEARLGHSLTKLDGVVEGTAICAFCASAYRAEHVRCTNCGGQARAA